VSRQSLPLTTMVLESREEIVAAFDGFRNEMDEMNDRRERIIKVLIERPTSHHI
jgi:hypothetical protein